MKINIKFSNLPPSVHRIDIVVDDLSTIFDDGIVAMFSQAGGELDLGDKTSGEYELTAVAFNADGIELESVKKVLFLGESERVNLSFNV